MHALGSSQYPVLKVPKGLSLRSLFHNSLSFLAKQLGYITRLGHWSQELFWKKLKKVFEVTRKTKRNAAKVNATLRFILQILFKTVAVTFARRRF